MVHLRYENFLKLGGNLGRELRNICAVDGCENGSYWKVCAWHAKRIRMGLFPEQHGVTRNPPCEYPGCDDPKYTTKATYCRAHFEYNLSGVSPEDVRHKRKNSGLTNKTCLTSGCGRAVHARGLCSKHYNETRPGYEKPEPKRIPCSVLNCPRKCNRDVGTCAIHLSQMRIHGRTWNGRMPYELTNAYRQSLKVECAVQGCDKKQSSLESILCLGHRGQANKMTAGDQILYADLKSRTQCDICSESGKLVFDHDHSCCPGGRACEKCIRGVLCNGCNSVLGHSRDSQEVLNRAIEYLHRWDTREES